jgi:hypothetical protein
MAVERSCVGSQSNCHIILALSIATRIRNPVNVILHGMRETF